MRSGPGGTRASRPVVSVDPAMRFGAPHIKGISTDAIVGLYIGEQGNADAVQADYGLTRHELLLALWFEGTHGAKAMRRLLGEWASKVAYPVLAGWDKAAKAEDLDLPEVATDLPRY